jgi:hypothetical protein
MRHSGCPAACSGRGGATKKPLTVIDVHRHQSPSVEKLWTKRRWPSDKFIGAPRPTSLCRPPAGRVVFPQHGVFCRSERKCNVSHLVVRPIPPTFLPDSNWNPDGIGSRCSDQRSGRTTTGRRDRFELVRDSPRRCCGLSTSKGPTQDLRCQLLVGSDAPPGNAWCNRDRNAP